MFYDCWYSGSESIMSVVIKSYECIIIHYECPPPPTHNALYMWSSEKVSLELAYENEIIAGGGWDCVSVACSSLNEVWSWTLTRQRRPNKRCYLVTFQWNRRIEHHVRISVLHHYQPFFLQSVLWVTEPQGTILNYSSVSLISIFRQWTSNLHFCSSGPDLITLKNIPDRQKKRLIFEFWSPVSSISGMKGQFNSRSWLLRPPHPSEALPTHCLH